MIQKYNSLSLLEMKKDLKYILLSGITGLILQLGAMMLVALFLVWFHDQAKSITSVIGLLTLIIGIGIAHLIAVNIHNYLVKDSKKRELSQKGNNYATLVLIVVVPFLIYPYLDWLEVNLTQTIYYSAALTAFLIGISLCFYLTTVKVD